MTRSGVTTALRVLNRELISLSNYATKMKNDVDDYLTIGTELLDIHRQFIDIVESKQVNEASVKKLESLTKRRDKITKIQKKDFTALMDRQFDAEQERDELHRVIHHLESWN